MSSYKYTTSELDNLAVHLTNNAIQKLDPEYGAHEDANQLSFK